MTRSDARVTAVWAVFWLAAIGCGARDRLEPVAGEVVFADGRPVVGGVVEFDPVAGPGRPARAAIGPDGRFSLRSGAAVGARPGRYRVAVVGVAGDPALAPHHHDRPAVHPRYASARGSGLVAEVVAGGPNRPRIVVEPASAASPRQGSGSGSSR